MSNLFSLLKGCGDERGRPAIIAEGGAGPPRLSPVLFASLTGRCARDGFKRDRSYDVVCGKKKNAGIVVGFGFKSVEHSAQSAEDV